ncbi:hypothetical protein ACQPYK_42840 [Streptosporangium sp. CA-135522]|uniref:hypothetical protein n=1 Tax=Streptosporangium sp. CA-135522 TaxID=3240072 RepID=UPI003D948F20
MVKRTPQVLAGTVAMFAAVLTGSETANAQAAPSAVETNLVDLSEVSLAKLGGQCPSVLKHALTRAVQENSVSGGLAAFQSCI